TAARPGPRPRPWTAPGWGAAARRRRPAARTRSRTRASARQARPLRDLVSVVGYLTVSVDGYFEPRSSGGRSGPGATGGLRRVPAGAPGGPARAALRGRAGARRVVAAPVQRARGPRRGAGAHVRRPGPGRADPPAEHARPARPAAGSRAGRPRGSARSRPRGA